MGCSTRYVICLAANKKKNRTIVFEKSAEMLAAEKDRMLIA